MRIYLAARYDRREELNAYANELRSMGFTVDARWLLGEHQIHEGARKVEAARESVPIEAAPFAQDDVDDVMAASAVISFTEKPYGAPASRGGRHVEFGIALATKKRVMVVGPRENVFHCLPGVEVYQTWADAKAALAHFPK